ncbi:MAG TPA: Hsp20/alpha crystallin family protein [Polyangiaceae bacterium]|jgi:HSP20 family protein|nr:Hsp20/alpha crystallin family protein [Polyangiaceae bacterium]
MLVRFNDRSGFPVFGASRNFPVSTLRRELDRLFGDLERAPSFGGLYTPQISFEDGAEALKLRAELPGLTEKDIEISVTANVLSLKASRKVEAPEGYTAHRRERSSFSFAQSYELPTRVDPEKVEASLKQGVLTLTLPKAAEVQPKKVAVNVAA